MSGYTDDLVDAGVREHRSQSAFEAFHVVRVGFDEKIEIGRRASQPVQAERHGADLRSRSCYSRVAGPNVRIGASRKTASRKMFRPLLSFGIKNV